MFVARAYNPRRAGPWGREPATGGEMTEFEDTFPDIGSMHDEELKVLLLGKVPAVPEEEIS